MPMVTTTNNMASQGLYSATQTLTNKTLAVSGLNALTTGSSRNFIVDDASSNLISGIGHSREIETKLRSLMPKKTQERDFNPTGTEEAIAALGDVEPMFGHSVTGLAETLLRCAPDPREGHNTSLVQTGLFYGVFGIYGMPDRIRTTYSGLALLDYWASKHKAFAPYVDCYIQQEVRDNIADDCFTLSLGKMPKWIKDAVAHGEKVKQRYALRLNRQQTIKWERQQAELQKMYQNQMINHQINNSILDQLNNTMIGQTSVAPLTSSTSAIETGTVRTLQQRYKALISNGLFSKGSS
jgi:hypothetical protein